MEYSEKIAEYLLSCNAIKLQPTEPFTWASGWKSPIYCDNRKTLAFPEARSYIKNAFYELISKKFLDYDVIAAVATGAIAQGAMVADALCKPFCYIRSAPKDHGLSNLIEGDLKSGQKVVIIEDLISTGGSSLKAVEAVRSSGGIVEGMAAIFTYDFPSTVENFAKAGVAYFTLCDYNILLEYAVKLGFIRKEQLEILAKWRKAPEKWGTIN
jgi:orotate phosphoribosyltransferase